MKVLNNQNKSSVITFLAFLLILFIAYLPASSFLFFIKNDAFNNYFPPKFFMSESIRSGYLPLWNPYINFGFPQYGDMNSGFWSPFTWLIASTVGYNAFSFTIETLLYILAGGLGMYRLTSYWELKNPVRLMAGVAFMCCGYNVGHLQHFNWLSGAAFLPWCLWSYLLLLRTLSIRTLLTAALFIYLLVASAHPGIIISAVYFFTATGVFFFFKKKTGQLQTELKKLIATHIALFMVLVLLCAGIVAGYTDILPHFLRGEKISLVASLENPATFQSWISTLLPFATVKNSSFYQTDPSMRNSYFGLTFLLFLVLACTRKLDPWKSFLLVAGGFFGLLSTGGFFKTLAYNFMPLLGYVRLNGEFRIFALLCFIVIAAIELDRFTTQHKLFSGKIVWGYYTIELLILALVAFGVYKSFNTGQSFVFQPGLFSAQGLGTSLKALIDAITFFDSLWIGGIIQLMFMWGIKWCLKSRNFLLLQRITVANLIVTTLLNLPYTGVGKASVNQVQEVLNKSPMGIVTPALHPISTIPDPDPEEAALIGSWSMYNKQVGVRQEVPYPIILKNMRAYFDSIQANPSSSNSNRPFIFLNPEDPRGNIAITRFSPGSININVTTLQSSSMVLQQNYYPYWYYKNGSRLLPVKAYGINFMQVPLSKGTTQVRVVFEPVLVKYMMLLSAASFVFCCAWLLLVHLRSSSRAQLRK